MKRLTLLLFSVITFFSISAENLYAPVAPVLSPIERTTFQKGIGVSTDITVVALPVAALTTVLIERDWQGLKQGVFTGIAAAGSMLILKYSVSELRPDHSNYHSFPSGHSTIAFASAAFMQRRYGWKWGIPAYTVATYTAVGRVLAKKHHWWDCVAGAAIGAASAYIFTTPWAREHEFSMAPVATDSAVGLTLSMSL